MATYKYQAFDKSEKKVSGIISASDTIEARNILISRELNPLKIVPGKENKSKTKISQKELSIFTKQLSALLSAGTPLETSLMLLSQQSKSKFTNVLLEINDDITEGKGLSESMKKFPQIFDDIYTSTIFAGESSASLPEVFNDLASYLDKEAKVRAEVVGALVYPAILFFVSLAVIYALLTFVLPQVIEQFVTSNVALPSLTLILLNFSNIFPYIVGSVLFISLGMYFYLNSPLSSGTIKLQASKYLLKMPLFGEVIIYDQTARFCSSMRLMTKAGLNTIDSLRIAKDTFRNRYLRSEVDIVVNKVTSGTSLSLAFSKSTIFPNVFQQLLSSGDIGSQISLMFEKIKDFLDQEVQTRRNVLLTLLQPIVILTMGVFVMLIVLAIMLPLLQMNNLIFTL
ncbi:MAG: type II secretion system F family protein [Gammaproteobacteria bacterium]